MSITNRAFLLATIAMPINSAHSMHNIVLSAHHDMHTSLLVLQKIYHRVGRLYKKGWPRYAIYIIRSRLDRSVELQYKRSNSILVG